MSGIRRVVFSSGGSGGNGEGPVKAALDICPDIVERVRDLSRDLDLGYRALDQNETDPETLALVRRIMRDLGRPERTRAAARELSRTGKRAVSAVLTSCYLLRNQMAIQAAVNFLREIAGDPEVKARLMAGITMKNDGTREVCQQALGDNLPAAYMIALLSNTEIAIEERVQAGERLCRVRSLEAIPHLIDLLAAKCSKPHERKAVQSLAPNLGLMGPDIYDPLYRGMQECDSANRENFYLAFGNTGPAGRQFLLQMFNPSNSFVENKHIIRCLGKQARRDTGGVEAMVNLLKTHPTGEWRYLVIEELGKSKLKEAIPAMRELLNDTDSAVRGRCFTSLARLNCREIIPLAEQALNRPAVEMQAAEALGCLGEERGIEHLLNIAVKSAGTRRRQALEALGRLGMAAVEYLAGQLGTADQVRVQAIIEALGNTRGAKAKHIAAQALTGVFHWAEPQQIAAACKALKSLEVNSQPVTRELQRVADGYGSPQEKKAAREALEHLYNYKSRPGGGGWITEE